MNAAMTAAPHCIAVGGDLSRVPASWIVERICEEAKHGMAALSDLVPPAQHCALKSGYRRMGGL